MNATKPHNREVLMVGPQMGGADVSQWTDEQRRLGGAWSKHEIEHRTDALCAPYEWQPGWTSLTADQIQAGLRKFWQK